MLFWSLVNQLLRSNFGDDIDTSERVQESERNFFPVSATEAHGIFVVIEIFFSYTSNKERTFFLFQPYRRKNGEEEES
jgi:hypothetical protein